MAVLLVVVLSACNRATLPALQANQSSRTSSDTGVASKCAHVTRHSLFTCSPLKMLRRPAVLCAVVIALAGCSSTDFSPSGPNAGESSASRGSAPLSLGLPAQFDPERDHLLPNMHASVELTHLLGRPIGVGVKHGMPPAPVVSDTGGSGGGVLPTGPTPTDQHRGWYLPQVRDIYVGQLQIGHNPNTGQWASVLPTETWALIYSPTLLPVGSCIETTVVHWNGSSYGSPGHDHLLGLWDWCNHPTGGFQVALPLDDPSFLASYTRNVNNSAGSPEQAITVEVRADRLNLTGNQADCWTAYLYNYARGGWEGLYGTCGVTQLYGIDQRSYTTGWLMHETSDFAGQYGSGCRQIPSIGATAVRTYNASGTPANVLSPYDAGTTTSELINGYCWVNAYWKLNELSGTGPTPGWEGFTWTGGW